MTKFVMDQIKENREKISQELQHLPMYETVNIKYDKFTAKLAE